MKIDGYHVPVLLAETVDGLNIKPDGVYVDVTFGGGGHSKEILSRLGENGRLFSFDQDPDAKRNIPEDSRLTFVASNFRYLKNFVKMHGVRQVDGVLADLGVSSHQFDEADRGFTIREDAFLNMRMDQAQKNTAADVLNKYGEEALATVFYLYGEFKNSRALAREIVQARADKKIERVDQLKTILMRHKGKLHENKFFARVFQALRIEVNEEMEALKEMLIQAQEMLSPEGRLSVLSYHSLEDRMVKNLMKKGNIEGLVKQDFFGNIERPFKEINRKPIIPTDEEIKENSRARSAKLRIAEKLSHA